jgi:RNA polymerase II-associated protein 2
MAMEKTPKSILKKSQNLSSASTKERDRELAVYHATLIQQRKNVEMEILLSIERLIEFPDCRGSNAANPAIEDVALFKKLLKQFQPCDYDSLIEERNINENCGYALCPKQRVKDNSSGRFRLIGMSGRAKDFKVVPKEELEKWCSEDCARRALYVKVQLNEQPGWERIDSTVEIELLDEQKTETERTQAQLIGELKMLDLGKSIQDAEDLALERGDRGVAARVGNIRAEIVEKAVTRAGVLPSVDAENLDRKLATMHLTMEGHTPDFGTSQLKQHQYSEDKVHGYSDDDTTMEGI